MANVSVHTQPTATATVRISYLHLFSEGHLGEVNDLKIDHIGLLENCHHSIFIGHDAAHILVLCSMP